MAATLLSKGAIPHFWSDDVDDDNEVLRQSGMLWAASLAIAVLHPWLLLGIYAIAPFLAWYAIERR